MHRWIWRGSNHLMFWLLLDACYVVALFAVPAFRPLPFATFVLAHLAGIAVGTLVMYTGVGAGVVWFPFFTLLGFHPADAASFSLFNQLAGKGSGSFKYVREGMIDWPANPPLLFGTVPGVMIGAQSGSRLVRFAFMKRVQPAVFMAVLALSTCHMIYEFLRRL